MRAVIATLVVLLPCTAFAAKWEMPGYVTTKTGPYRGAYADTVDFSYQAGQVVDFAKAKLCVAENVSNNAVSLQDSAGSFVGPATGTYYRDANSQTVQGGTVFKYIDDSTSTLIASGTADGGTSSLGLVHDLLKFDLKIVTAGEAVTIRFSNILRAQQNTGSLVNDGFQPVGTWKGSRFQHVYASLEGVAGKMRSCLQ